MLELQRYDADERNDHPSLSPFMAAKKLTGGRSLRLLTRIIHGQTKNYDTVSIEGCAWRSEGTETNSFNAVFGAWLGAHIFSQAFACSNSVCRPLQGTGSSPSLWRARPSIAVTSA